MYKDKLPERVRVLVLGGGIHGAGVLHDLASRGWSDIHLVERDFIGSGTSSRSTKLIHGGLRYLQRISQFAMVSESLKERHTLLSLLPDLVKPVEILFPIRPKERPSPFVVRTGLWLYDILAGRFRIQWHKKISKKKLAEKIPIIDESKIKKSYSYWDAQTDDLALVQRVCDSAHNLGAGVTEGVEVKKIQKSEDGWLVEVVDKEGTISIISALYVVNAIGPWSNRLLEQSEIKPHYQGINNKGIHLIVRDLGLKSGAILSTGKDKRIFFILPWKGYTLIGTTEDVIEGDPSKAKVLDAEVDYLLAACNRYLKNPLSREDIVKTFWGLRWLAVEQGMAATATSREVEVSEHLSNRGVLYTIYGGKLTSYRSFSEKLGDRILMDFGEFRSSRTTTPEAWVKKSVSRLPEVEERF